jgi:putative zinc finger protein
MNCQQVQDLLPLYAGSDLEERRARLVAAHVQTCETCAEVAREYRETQQLIQTFVPPAFTEDFYAEMRQSVWQNLEKKSTSRAFPNIIVDLFRPRLAWAVATAVLIAVSAVGIYVISHRGAVSSPAVSNQPSPSRVTQDDRPTTSSQTNASAAHALASSGSNIQPANVHQPDRRQKRKTISDRVNLPAVSTVAAVSPAAISAPQTSDLRQTGNGSSDASQAPLRMEIQTKNPNIRIIWFAPRDAKSSSRNSRGI